MEITIKGNNFISSYASIIIDGHLFVSDLVYHALYEIDLNSNMARLCGVFKSDSRHKFVFQNRDELWWIPESNKSTSIDIYNMKSMEFESVSLSKESKYDDNCRFSGVFRDEIDHSIVWCIPCCASLILKINTEMRSIDTVPLGFELSEKNTILISSIRDVNNIYACKKNNADIYRFKKNDGFECIYHNSNIKCENNMILAFDNTFYLVPRKLNNPWIAVDKNGDNEELIDFGIDNDLDCYTEVQFGDVVWAIPYLGDVLYRFDLKDRAVEGIPVKTKDGRASLNYWISYKDEKKAILTSVDDLTPFVLMNKEGVEKEISVSDASRDLEVLLARIDIIDREWK